MATDGGRAGTYHLQERGYRAFIPRALPPDPPVEVSGEIQTLLSIADRNLGRLDGSIQTIPDPDLFVYMFVRKEAVLSSQIEGTQSSLQDLLAAEANILSGSGDVDDVVRYVAAMNYGLARLSTLPVSVRLIKEIHERLMTGARGGRLAPGELRTSQNWIGPAGATLADATFVPPPPHVVPEALSDLERFLHQSDSLPLLVKIGLVHAQFETIHPFLDGNGRVGRLLITLLLCERGVLEKPVLYLSHYFKRNRETYYARLQSVRDDGDWERWVEFFLRGVAEVSDEATETARQIVALRERLRTKIATKLGRASGHGHLILEDLFRRPITSVKRVQQIMGTTYPSANKLVAGLVEIGVLEETTGNKRNRQYRFSPYIELFTAG